MPKNQRTLNDHYLKKLQVIFLPNKENRIYKINLIFFYEIALAEANKLQEMLRYKIKFFLTVKKMNSM